MNSWLDMLPSNERQKIREKYKMSPAAYEKLRQNVKGPEQLKEEMQWNEQMAQLRFALETEPHIKEALQKQIEKDIAEQGIEAVVQNPDIPQELREKITSGKFEVTVDSVSEDVPDQLTIHPEGNVSEKIPISHFLTETYVSQLQDDK